MHTSPPGQTMVQPPLDCIPRGPQRPQQQTEISPLQTPLPTHPKLMRSGHQSLRRKRRSKGSVRSRSTLKRSLD